MTARKMITALCAVCLLLATFGAGSASAVFDVTTFDGTVLEENGDPATQAGAHPHTAQTTFFVSTVTNPFGQFYPSEDIQNATVEIPPGLVGNPEAYPTCSQDQLQGEGAVASCPPESQVGELILMIDGEFSFPPEFPYFEIEFPVYNMETANGTPALFGINVLSALIQVYPSLRTGEDYGLTVQQKNSPQTLTFEGVKFEFWGVPADPSHTPKRKCQFGFGSCPSSAPLKPFLSLPTACLGPLETFITVDSWQGGVGTSSFLSHDNSLPTPQPIGAEFCNAVDFSPTIEARPTTNVADAPSGLEFNLEVPQSEDPNGTATAHLRDTEVTLPEGMVLNPSAGNGLDGCSPAEADLSSKLASHCPDASRLGSVEVESPLVDHPLLGSVYIADPYDNPFNSLLALYISVNDPRTGLVVKLAGEVKPDPQTGRLTTYVKDGPQLPFENFRLKFFGGAGGALRTPAVCGTYATTSSLTPWTAPDSGPPDTPQDNWEITQGPNGGACASSEATKPHTPDLDAGTVSPIAGSHSPLVVNLRREDGSQEFSTVTITPPPGLTGKLAGIPYCPESALAAAAGKSGNEEKASPSCPAASRIGTVDVAAGAGPAPYWAQGTAYLTGPYKGAPISLAIVTPATAGPFDLGTVVVRTALRVNPVTTQITADSDPLPSILQGIPLDIRQALIRLDRPSFTLNGTSCDPLAFSGSLVSTLGATAPLSERFQLGECSGLPFKPKMTLSLLGPTKRTKNPRLVANVSAKPGEANIGYARVTLPSIAFLDNSHIGTVCTRVQFAADQCPADSIYGTASATTPLLDGPLSGTVYLRSSSNPLPDLVVDLRGPATQPIKVELSGVTDSFKGALRNTFQAVPDAPVSSFRLELFGGKKGLVELSRNLCAKRYRANVELEGQNGKVFDNKPVVKSSCKKKKKKRAGRHARGSARAVR